MSLYMRPILCGWYILKRITRVHGLRVSAYTNRFNLHKSLHQHQSGSRLMSIDCVINTAVYATDTRDLYTCINFAAHSAKAEWDPWSRRPRSFSELPCHSELPFRLFERFETLSTYRPVHHPRELATLIIEGDGCGNCAAFVRWARWRVASFASVTRAVDALWREPARELIITRRCTRAPLQPPTGVCPVTTRAAEEKGRRTAVALRALLSIYPSLRHRRVTLESARPSLAVTPCPATARWGKWTGCRL